MFDTKYLITFLLALIPSLIWASLFLKKHSENKWLVFFTFMGGVFAAQLILLYKGYWDSTINLLFAKVTLVDFRGNISSLIVNTALASFVTFLGIGAMEEFSKFWVMKFISRDFFRSIDDVISLAIISALGFSFYENFIYFNGQWANLTTNGFLLLVASRVTIVTMVHMLCSGVLGYYFGLAHFASPILRMEHAERKQHPVLAFLNRVLNLKKSVMYHNEMMTIGLISAMFLHAMYDFILSSTANLNSIFISATVLLYFFGGYYFLSYLIRQRRSKLELGLLLNKTQDER